MSRTFVPALLVLAGLLVGGVLAEQIAYYPFEEGQGTTTADVTGNGNDGTLSSGVEWVVGYRGVAVHFDTAGERIVTSSLDPTASNNAMTLAAWINWEGQGHSISQQGIIGKRLGWDPGTGVKWFWQTNPAGDLLFRTDNAQGGTGLWWGNGLLVPYANQWTHVALTWDDGDAVQYINGEEVRTGSVTFRDTADDTPVTIGCVDSTNTETFVGTIDEVRMYDTALTVVQLQQVMVGDYTSSTAPVPADGATDIPQDVVVSWMPGDFAVSHDVYLGTNRADVEAADRSNPLGVLVSEGQTELTYDPVGLLDFGATYYWRIDEVNGAPDYTVHKGSVWSFTIEPFVYAVTDIIATASSAQGDSGPEKTIDGSGINNADQHSIAADAMWLTAADGEQPSWIQYEFPEVYKLHEMWVWNYNVQFELVLGFGLKDVAIEYSSDGAEWTALGDFEFARATAKATYEHNTTIDLDGVAARYVRLTANSNWSGMMPQFGLSEVRFYYKPVVAREPAPADGQTDLGLDVSLDWRSGREAAAHDVYLGTDAQAVADGTASVETVEESRYDLMDLNLGTTYYWKVNEVNEAATPSVWEGAVWSFSTLPYVTVEDFEVYDDDIESGTAIFQTWIDGWENGTGSIVGYFDPPFAERAIVRSGKQSMPLAYDNSDVANAEAVRTFEASQDWTTNGIQTLSLYFRGTAGNTGQLYVKIDGTKVPYDGDAADIAKTLWQPWNIDLSSVGGNLRSVDELTVGIEGAGATGMVYIDDIRLYPDPAEYVTPVEPGTANLVAHYAFDGNLSDTTGNGYNGVANGEVAYGDGRDGQAVQLNGADAYVSIAEVGITGAAARTLSGWAKADSTDIAAWTNVFGFTGPSGNGGHFDIEAVGDTANTTLGYYGLHRYGWERDIIPIDLEWHHLAATYDGQTANWYGDGLLVGSAAVDPAGVNPPGPVHIGKREDNTEFFPGLVDEVRIYDRALSEGEVAWLAGRRMPAHKPL